MENAKIIKFLFVMIGALLAPVFSIQAYDNEFTHPALTQEVIKFFENSFPEYKLSEEDKEIIEKGSKDEDIPSIRCLNHFYDPIYKKGLKGNFSAKNWAKNTEIQAILDLTYLSKLAHVSQELFGSETDFSFDRAVFEFVHRDRTRALETLGHTLHLIEDMAVPAHTRDDIHIIEAPFEEFAKKFTKENIDIASGLINQNEEVIIFDNLNQYFESLALFSNTNFFSLDTVLIDKYDRPKIDFKRQEVLENGRIRTFGYSKDLSNKVIEIEEWKDLKTGEIETDYKLFKIDSYYDKPNKSLDSVFLVEDENNLIFNDYWSLLSKQAVLHGAGVMKLFFDEVEKEKETLALLEKNNSLVSELTSGIKQITSNITGFFSEVYAELDEATSEIDRMDLIASVGEGVQEKEAGDFAPQNPSNLSNPNVGKPKTQASPEDPGSPELQRLALILREAERMLERAEKEVDNFEGQNVGGSRENLILEDLGTGTGENDSSQVVYNPGFGGGGGGVSAPTTSTQTVANAISTTTTTTATSTPTTTTATSTPSTTATSTPSTTTSTSTPTTTATSTIIISPPQITTPSDLTQTFTVNNISFSGTASSTQIISTDFSLATTTVNSNGLWDLNLTGFNIGTTAINFYASDNQGNISSPTTISLYVNTFSPDVSLSISQCNNSISSSSCLVSATTLDVLWLTTASASDFAYFNIENNGIFSTTTATSTQITNLGNGDAYQFSVATVAQNGNVSATSTQQVKINTLPIVINEIAWAGTGASTDDEWIELYNSSDENIDLSDWVLYATDGAPDLSFSNANDKIIEAGTYYLIERSDDTTVNDVTADFITPFSGLGTSNGLENGGEHLILAYKKSGQATTTIDSAPFGSNWIYKDGTRTLERYDFNSSGSDTNNWDLPAAYSASASLLNGEDAIGNRINGTPRARNSINYKIAKNGILNEDKTITKINSPYVVTSEGLNILAGKTLTIEEGVVIKSLSNIVISGSIQSDGTQTEPVIFTHFYDDEQEDTNGDGFCVLGTNCPGDFNYYWPQLILKTGSLGSEFNNTIFKYGGYRSSTLYPRAMIVLNNAQANFDNILVENSRGSGISLKISTSTISNSIIRDNYKRQTSDNEDFYGIYALNGQVEVINSSFDNNQIGIGLFDTLGSNVSDNNFTNHEGFPLIMNGSAGFSLVNNSGSNNDKNGIQVCGYVTKVGSNTTLVKNPLPYIIEKSIEVMDGTSLTIEAGSIFKFKDKNINVAGELNVNGTQSNPVIFTSVYDDSDGTDVYGDGSTATSSISKKGGINLHSGISMIGNAEFRYLYQALSFLNCDPVQLNLENILFQNNTWSIYANNQNATVILAENLTFATTPISMNDAVKNALQVAKDAGAIIIW